MGKDDKLLREAIKLEKMSYDSLKDVAKELVEILKEYDPKLKKRISFSKNHRKKLLIEQGSICPSCKETINETDSDVDHIVPFSLGGGNEYRNTQALCEACNRSKGNIVEPDELVKYLEIKVKEIIDGKIIPNEGFSNIVSII